MSADADFTIRSVSFYKSLKARSKTPIRQLPEIAIAGKSNAGKSSLINYLCGRKRLAYVGKHPGKTRLVNYFVINDDFYLVDLPGYGFAQVSKSELQAWSTMMDGFFAESSSVLRGVLVCLDIRRDPSAQDIQMLDWARYYSIPCVVIATKCDKVAKSKRAHSVAKIRKSIQAQMDEPIDVQIIPVSSTERIGAEAVLSCIEDMLASVDS